MAGKPKETMKLMHHGLSILNGGRQLMVKVKFIVMLEIGKARSMLPSSFLFQSMWVVVLKVPQINVSCREGL